MKYAILLLVPLLLLACGGDPTPEDRTATATGELVARTPLVGRGERECHELNEKRDDMNCSWIDDRCTCAHNGDRTPTATRVQSISTTPDDICSPPPDDWPVLELSVDDFYGFGPLVQEGVYNLGGYQLVVPRDMWIERGLGWYPACAADQEPCPDEATLIYLTAGDRPPDPSKWLVMEWYRDDPTTWWRSDFETEPDCTCPRGAGGAQAVAVDTLFCYLEKLNVNRP